MTKWCVLFESPAWPASKEPSPRKSLAWSVFASAAGSKRCLVSLPGRQRAAKCLVSGGIEIEKYREMPMLVCKELYNTWMSVSMYMYVCIYVCMSACSSPCLYVCMHVRTHACSKIFMLYTWVLSYVVQYELKITKYYRVMRIEWACWWNP